MSYAPPNGILSTSWLSVDSYSAPKSRITAHWGSNPRYISASGIKPATFSPVLFSWTGFAQPHSIDESVVAQWLTIGNDSDHLPKQFSIDASWQGSEQYSGPLLGITVTWANLTYIAPVSVSEVELPNPVLTWTETIAPAGFNSLAIQGSNYVLHPWEYAFPEWSLDANWVGKERTYSDPINPINAAWTLPAEESQLPVTGWDALTIPGPSVKRLLEIISPEGWEAFATGQSDLRLAAKGVNVRGFESGTLTPPVVFNWRQYVLSRSFNSSVYGQPFVSGGVKQVLVRGDNLSRYGSLQVVNTTADQPLLLKGWSNSDLGEPTVSPRMLYPDGIYGTASEGPVVQFPPYPKGWDSSLLGNATIDYWTAYLQPQNIGSDEIVGYPKVYDPTQKAFALPVLGTGIFGDTRIDNLAAFLEAAGFDAFEGSVWAELRSNRRYLHTESIWPSESSEPSIRNKTPSIIPKGVDSVVLGTPHIGYRVRYIYGRGLDNLSLGKGTVTQPPSIAPKGITGDLGNLSIWHRVRSVQMLGDDLQKQGTPTIWFRYRYLVLEGFYADSYGNYSVEHGRRKLLGRGNENARYGRPAVSNANRLISPSSIYKEFATGHMVGGLRYLNPVGYEATQFGDRIIPERQYCYPLGFSELYGDTRIYNQQQTLKPASATWQQPADRWGAISVWNRRQYVVMYYDPHSQLNPPQWPKWQIIENRNKALRTIGQESLKLGDHRIENGARALLPSALAAPLIPSNSMIAMRVRSLHLAGLEPPYMPSWHRAYNDALVIAPLGAATHSDGHAVVENTRRYYNWVGGYDSSRLGYPMVADRIRDLSIEKRYAIDAPRILGPEVKLHTRYIDGIGYQTDRVGLPALSIHWTRVTPRWKVEHFFGHHVVNNVTPELATRGRLSELFGNIRVRLEWRPISVEGAITTLFGKTTIADRDRTVQAPGLRAGAFGDKLKVIKTGAPPYSLQMITLDGQEDDNGNKGEGDGIPPPQGGGNDQVPKPVLNQLVIYVRQTSPMTKYGNALVEANSVRVEPGYSGLVVGEHVINLKVRRISVSEFPKEEVFQPEKARLSPHTIYAVKEAPRQAIDNHRRSNSNPLHYVDGLNRPPTAIFGRAHITLRNRTLVTRHPSQEPIHVGRPHVSLGTRYILAPSFRSFRSGFHEIPTDRTLEQYDSSMMSVFGGGSVGHVAPIGPANLYGQGKHMFSSGHALIEHFHRTIYPVGNYATRTGTKKYGDTPYMWQGLRVGELMPTIPDSIDASFYGQPWVSHRVRGLEGQGFDAFLCEYQLEAFAQRMRVRNSHIPMPPELEIDPSGILPCDIGTPDIRNIAHYIKPDGNSEQYRKGAF